jgi:flagellar hook-basal body complex protein FliE
MGGINASQISAMLAQIRSVSAQTQPPALSSAMPAVGSTNDTAAIGGASGSFADALKTSLAAVNASQQQADTLGNRFATGDNSVSLSQTMIAMQKANISFQEAVQVRDRLVSAYTTIMNMQV